MEVKIENKIKIKSGNIIGIFDIDNYFIDYLKKITFRKTNISLNGKKLNQIELIELKRKISIVDKYIDEQFLNLTVYEYMKKVIINNLLDLKDYKKKIADSIKIVGLSDNYLDKGLSILSTSEQELLSFAVGLLSNPDIIILNNFFNSLDLKNTKKIMRLLSQLVEQYDKIVVIYNSNIETLYHFVKRLIVMNTNKVIIDGDTDTIFEEKIETFRENNIPIPKTIEFSYLVNHDKNVKLGYFKDIRDLIKDIYKKV